MTRVDELQKKYPSVPREVIVKSEVVSCGIRDSAVLDKLGRWKASGGPQGGYQSYDHDVTLKELAGRRPTTVKPGYVKFLGPFHLRNGLGARIKRDSTSPYEIRELDSGQWALCEGEDKVEEIYFPHVPWPFEELEAPVTSRGTPATELVPMRSPNCFFITPMHYCEYFSLGEECKFCNFNATQDDARSVGMSIPVAANLEETVEAYEILSSEVRFFEGAFQMGGLKNSEQEAKLHLSFVEKMSSAASYKPNLTINTQPMSRKNMERLKEAGLNCMAFQMEVWDPRLFAEICPGKAKYIGYEHYKEAFLEAADVFGVGNAFGNFVGGVTLLPPDGHTTWQESRDSIIDGLRWLSKNGVFSYFCYFRWAPGSVYSRDLSNREKRPPTEYYLDTAVAHHEATKEHGLYQKMNKLSATCPMDCLTHAYCGDMGFLEIAGNIGNWIAGAIPEKANWLARFNSSVNTQ